MSFFDLFGPSTPSRSGSRISRQEKKKPTNEESAAGTETSPKSTAATEAPSEPITTESESVEWTTLEEMALLGMKARNMSWKEIDEALPGKDMEGIKNKYKMLYADAPGNVKPKEGDVVKEEATKDGKKEAKPDEAKDAKEDNKGESEDKEYVRDNPWRKNQEGFKAWKGKGKAEEAKPEEVKPEEAKPEETKAEESNATLKAKPTAEEKGKGGQLKSIHGHPVIFVDDDEELDFNELLYLYGLNARYDELKWITIDSKFFDRFGKRVGAEKLKEKMAGVL